MARLERILRSKQMKSAINIFKYPKYYHVQTPYAGVIMYHNNQVFAWDGFANRLIDDRLLAIDINNNVERCIKSKLK